MSHLNNVEARTKGCPSPNADADKVPRVFADRHHSRGHCHAPECWFQLGWKQPSVPRLVCRLVKIYINLDQGLWGQDRLLQCNADPYKGTWVFPFRNYCQNYRWQSPRTPTHPKHFTNWWWPGFSEPLLVSLTKLGDEKETPCILIYTSSGFFFHLPPQVHVVTIIHPANSYSLVNLF